MDTKSFVKGVICGASAVAVVVWIWNSNKQIPSSGETKVSVKSKSEQAVGGHASTWQPADQQQFAPSMADLHSSNPSVATTQTERPAENGTQSSNDDEEEYVARDAAYYLAERRQELKSEPKDDSWAYFMEQTISQFLGRHTGIAEFEVSYVECRTTICQIQVIGFDDSTVPTWSRIMYDLRKSLPEEYYEWGWSGYPLEGRHAIVQTIKRRDP